MLARLAAAAGAAPLALAAQSLGATEVRVCTDRGQFTIELAPEAPAHTANFLRLVESGFYNGTIFHRVVGGTIVQGGGFDRRFVHRPAGEPVVNESQNGLGNERGTVAAARLREPDTATSQFFVNLTDNEALDATPRRPGYTVFGRVTGGMDVVDGIGRLPTGAGGPLPAEVPDPIVVIEAITIIEPPASTAPPATSAETLARIDALRADCAPVPAAELVNEADAALAAGLIQRGRFALENYFALVDADDPDIARAQSLFRTLPRTEQEGIAPLIAHCQAGDPPALPAGRSAALADMQQAQTAVRKFLTVSEAFLDCLAEVIDSGSLDDVQEVAAVSTHNETVARMERVAEDFNRELRAYRARD